MKSGRLLIGTLILQVNLALANAGSEPASPAIEPSTVRIRKSGGGGGPGSGSSKSHLDGFSPEALKKVAELAKPVEVEVLSRGRSVDGLEDIKERIIDVKVTNPNSYKIFFRGRQYKDNKTIRPIWRAVRDGSWTVVGQDLCGTGGRDWEIEPQESLNLMLYLHPKFKEQQILGTFYKLDQPSVQSDCLLYEVK